MFSFNDTMSKGFILFLWRARIITELCAGGDIKKCLRGHFNSPADQSAPAGVCYCVQIIVFVRFNVINVIFCFVGRIYQL